MLSVVILNYIFRAYMLMLFARILCSWVPELNQYKIMRIIAQWTDPYLNFFRRFIPPIGMIDFSPIVAFVCLGFIQNILTVLLLSLRR